jgi:hypothetical protein
VRRSIVFDVRDEFRALQAEVERKATVHAIRQQQQQQANQQEPALPWRQGNTAAAVSSVLAAATPAVYARPSTLCRPHWPSPPAAPVPALTADDVPSTPPHDRCIAGSKLSEHEDASEEEKKDGADSASMRAPGPSLHVSSPPLTDSLLAAQAAAAPSTAAAATPFSPRTALDVHILGVQAAIRQRLLVSQRDAGEGEDSCPLRLTLCSSRFSSLHEFVLLLVVLSARFSFLQHLRQEQHASASTGEFAAVGVKPPS